MTSSCKEVLDDDNLTRQKLNQRTTTFFYILVHPSIKFDIREFIAAFIYAKPFSKMQKCVTMGDLFCIVKLDTSDGMRDVAIPLESRRTT